MRSLYALAAVLLLNACTPKKPYLYAVIEPFMYSELKGQAYVAKYIIIEESFSAELKEALVSIMESKNRQAEKMAQELSSDAERNFMLGVCAMENKDFTQARIYLSEVATENFSAQAALLLLDCQLESGEDMDYYQRYQQLYDRCDNPLLREVIKTRYQYYRHGI